MINKLLVCFLVIFFIGSFLAYICEGTNSLAASSLTSDITATDVVIPVTSTDDFPAVGTVTIGNETISYRGKTHSHLISCSRGIDNTTASAHLVGERVMGPDADALNRAVGFNIVNMSSSGGVFGFPVIAAKFMYYTLPRLVTFDFVFLEGDGLIWFRYFMMLFGIGLIFVVFYIIYTAVGSVGSTLFSRTS